MTLDLEIRRATPDDYEAVVDLTSDIWADRGGDYLPDVYHDWLEDEGEAGKKTFVAEVDGDLAGIVQAVMLTPDEAWFRSLRVGSNYRRMGVSQRLNRACFDWARERGATVGRAMVFSWNGASLAAARAGGFEPITEFRFAHPDPDAEASGPDGYAVSQDPAVAWRYVTHSEARDHLTGLALAPEESWAVRELTRADLERAAAEDGVFAITDADGVRAMAVRTRTVERPTDEDERRRWAEYGLAAWDDVDAARALFAAIARDAAALGADETRVLVPETARFVTDAACAGAIAEEPDFVLGVDLTDGGS